MPGIDPRTLYQDYGGPINWAGNVIYLGEQESLHLQVVGTPSVPYVIQRSLTIDEWSPATLFTYGSALFPDGAWVMESISAAGFYTGTARGYFRFVIGAGSQLYLSAHPDTP